MEVKPSELHANSLASNNVPVRAHLSFGNSISFGKTNRIFRRIAGLSVRRRFANEPKKHWRIFTKVFRRKICAPASHYRKPCMRNFHTKTFELFDQLSKGPKSSGGTFSICLEGPNSDFLLFIYCAWQSKVAMCGAGDTEIALFY